MTYDLSTLDGDGYHDEQEISFTLSPEINEDDGPDWDADPTIHVNINRKGRSFADLDIAFAQVRLGDFLAFLEQASRIAEIIRLYRAGEPIPEFAAQDASYSEMIATLAIVTGRDKTLGQALDEARQLEVQFTDETHGGEQ